jgi:hypothetical protein
MRWLLIAQSRVQSWVRFVMVELALEQVSDFLRFPPSSHYSIIVSHSPVSPPPPPEMLNNRDQAAHYRVHGFQIGDFISDPAPDWSWVTE